MKLKTFIAAAALAGHAMTFSSVWAQQDPDPELVKAKEFFETAGIPGDRWVEGETMVPHIAPASHFKSAMLYYPLPPVDAEVALGIALEVETPNHDSPARWLLEDSCGDFLAADCDDTRLANTYGYNSVPLVRWAGHICRYAEPGVERPISCKRSD